MEKVTIFDLVESISKYDKSMIPDVVRAYNYAKDLHAGQVRDSGEEYIVHPLTVAYILSEMHADKDTLCAALLHDTLEDTREKREDIAHDFNETVASLVDGVTKLSKYNFNSKTDRNYANTRKIITSITSDVRVILIKLADRLHNMRTLEYKSEFKQKENAMETMEIFVPLAYNLGVYKVKTELEDLSLKYLLPDEYKRVKDEVDEMIFKSSDILGEMAIKIGELLSNNNVPNEVKIRIRNIYGIYRKKSGGSKLSDIHDLLALKVIVDELSDCYLSLGLVHSLYKPVNSKFKDYICNPKTNMYQSLHTTVFGPDDLLVQAQIRTGKMNRIDTYGIGAYYDIGGCDVMQDVVREKCQFFESLAEMDKVYKDNRDFVEHVKKELFSGNVYVYTSLGNVVQLPVGSTPIDFAYKIDPVNASRMVKAIVNDKKVGDDYILQNKDRVRILTGTYGIPKKEWESKVKTTRALSMIKKDLCE